MRCHLPGALGLLLLAAPAFSASSSAVRKSTSLPDFRLPEPPVADPIAYSADHFEYEGSTTGVDARITLRGNVEVRDSTWTLKAGELKMDMRTRKARAQGKFIMGDGINVLRGQRGEFHLGDKTGTVERVHTEYTPWRIWAKRGRIDDEGKAHFDKALFTSCLYEPPHYYLRASGVHVKPHKWLIATNVRFHVGPIPFFYSPILWKSLRKKKLLRTRMSPAYDGRNGGIMRTTTHFNPLRPVNGKLFLDYYTEQGLGTGSEIQLFPSEDARGALYGYRIKENGASDDRWTAFGSYYQTLSSSWSVQGRMQAQSDPDVNNHYLRSNAFRVTAELVNGGAFTRRTVWSTTRLSVSRTDVGDLATGRYRMQKESLPRLDFQTAPMSLPRIPILFNLSAFAENALDVSVGFGQKSAGAGIEATQTKNLFRGLSFTPRLAFRELFEDRRDVVTSFTSTRTYRDTFSGFYELGGNLRADTLIGTWDAGYAFVRRMKPDTFQDDSGALDYGIERNRATLQNTVRPSRRALLRVGGGYDFRRFRNRTVSTRNRVEPIAADLILRPSRDVQVSIRDVYHLEDGNRALLVQADWGERDSTFAALGLTHNLAHPDRFLGSLQLGWVPTGTMWKLGGALRALVRAPGGPEVNGFRLFEKELSISRNFHDFYTRVLVRFRPGNVKEVLVRVDLRTERRIVKRAMEKVWREEWFPWRKGEDSDDRE